MKRLLFAAGAIVVLAACDRGQPDEPAAPAPDEPAAEPAEPETTVPCEIASAAALIDSLQLLSADGTCRVFLPAEAATGEYTVRVSAAGSDDLAAVEVRLGDETLYATTGTVVVEAVDGGRIVGRVEAEDTASPATGRVVTAFDVALPGG